MAQPTANPLDVPLRIDALWADGVTETAMPTADFTDLQGSALPSGGNASNTDPWLGDTVWQGPAAQAPLPKGIHLHWTLPAALRHGTTVYVLGFEVYNELVEQGVPYALVQALQAAATDGEALTLDALTALLNGLVPAQPGPPLTAAAFTPTRSSTTIRGLISPNDGVNAYSNAPTVAWDPIFLEIYGPLIVRTSARLTLPPVPNRWLVVRTDGTANKAWVIESDRLSRPQDGKPLPGAGPTAIPGHFRADFVSGKQAVTLDDAIQYLGLVTPAPDWREATDGSYFTPLTAAGTGVPEFAAFYPNCRGVFGFHDANADATTPYSYTVIGWFADPTRDPASPTYAVAPWSAQSDLATRIADLGWSVAGTPDWATVAGSVYTARITAVTEAACPVQGPTSADSVNVAIGNTAGEALAAYLVNTFQNNPPPGVTVDGGSDPAIMGLSPETLLDAAQAGVLRHVLSADGTALIADALHQQAFQSYADGSLWHVVPLAVTQPGLSPTTPAAPPALAESVAQALNALNAAQMQFDRTQAHIKAQRHLLFTDWCRALHLSTDVAANNTNAFPNGGTLANSTTLQLAELAATAVNQTADAVDAAGMGNALNADEATMLAYRAGKALYLALAAAHSALAAGAAAPGAATGAYGLQRQAAPRFWRPNDPVVLMCAPTAASLQAIPADPLPTAPDSQDLLCTIVTPGTDVPAYLPATWSTGPSAGCVATIVSTATSVTACQSWRPLSLDWQAFFSAYPGRGSITPKAPDQGPFLVTDYSPGFITDSFVPATNGIDLAPGSGVTPEVTGRATYHGRVVLSRHAARTLQARILDLAGLDPADAPSPLTPKALPPALAPAAPLLAAAYGHAGYTLSQALDGFHDRLLMLRRIPQSTVFDPGYATALWNNADVTDATWDAHSQSFYVEIGQHRTASPQQSDLYNPIRAGQCQLTNLWLVDAFGQIRTWQPNGNNMTIAASLPKATADVENAAPAFLVPPRLAQPSRLLFRWLAADGTGDVESNPHPATSPICGWLALNRVDATILVFEKDGTLVGWIPAAGGPLVSWSDGTIQDPLLQQVVDQAVLPTSTLYDDIDTALLTISPKSHRQHTARSVLVSRPLALARASLRLETQGMPAPHQGYEWLATRVVDSTGLLATDAYSPMPASGNAPSSSPFPERETCGFESVAFPVRLGDVSMDDDGLVAYWRVTTSDSTPTLAPTYCLVGELGTAANGSEPTLPLVCDPSATPTQVLVLLDPRAPVHAVSGILPTKAIAIPPAMYADALRRMAVPMSVGPVLTPADQILMPMPTEVAGPWHWVTETPSAFDVFPQDKAGLQGKVDDRAHPRGQPAVIRQGWLQANAVD